MGSIHHQIAIRAQRAEVYRALAEPERIGTWWDQQTVVDTDEGRFMEHQAGPYGTVRLQVLEQAPDVRVVWTCVGDYPPDNPASAWVGTRLVFALSSDDSGAAMVERACSSDAINALTTVDFTQSGYDMRSRFAGFNTNAWGQVLQSLKRVCEAA